jgi:hypothetical protein
MQSIYKANDFEIHEKVEHLDKVLDDIQNLYNRLFYPELAVNEQQTVGTMEDHVALGWAMEYLQEYYTILNALK